MAMKYGHLNVVKYLHEHGANLKFYADFAYIAANRGHMDVYHWIRQHIAK